MMKKIRFIAWMLVLATMVAMNPFQAGAATADRFEDVNPKAWYYEDVAGAVDAGWGFFL